jgi:hypothetical protein
MNKSQSIPPRRTIIISLSVTIVLFLALITIHTLGEQGNTMCELIN